jgi:hypothetical protein
MMGAKARVLAAVSALAAEIGAAGRTVRHAIPRGVFASALAASVLAGCGPAPLPPKPPPPAPERLTKKLEAALASLEMPGDLLLAGRWKKPSAWLRQLESWSESADVLSDLLRTRLGAPSRPIDLDAPIELLVVLEREREPPALGWALSVGLEPSAGAASELAGPIDVESPLGWSCAESRALGPVSARMVCAPSDDQLARLLPHATRALPLAPLGEADIAIALRGAALSALDEERRRALSSSWLASAIGAAKVNDRFDAQRDKLSLWLARELGYLAQDLDGATIELSLSGPEQALELSLLAPAAGGRSSLGQLAVGSGATGLAPEEFWQTHQASDGAGFSWAFQAAPVARLREPLAALLGTLLDYRGVPNRLEQQARELVLYLPMPRGPVIHASGRLPPPGPREQRASWLEALGWQLYSVRGNFDEYQYYVGALAKSFNDPILGPQFGRLIRSSFGSRWVPVRMEQRRPITSGLPRGSFVLEITFAGPNSEIVQELPDDEAGNAGSASAAEGAVRAAPRSPELYVVFVPDEDGVRLAWGADERFLGTLLSQPGRSKGSATLAGRAGLGGLNEHRILAGGFFSLAGLEDPNPLERFGLSNGRAKQIEQAPHRGVSPIVYALSQPSETWLHLTTRLGRETIEDLLFLFGTTATASPPPP